MGALLIWMVKLYRIGYDRDNMIQGDTIAAIATASGPGAVSIVRVSGPEAFAVADRLFRCAPPVPSARPGGTFVYGRVMSAGGMVDEALMLIFRSPRSYTRENVVEIQGHGGPECARRILRIALEAGARPAEPGEFTRRAFLNGRLDLSQAEAVMELIAAQTDRAASTAVEQLRGGLSIPVDGLYGTVIHAAADLESVLDFPEEDFPESVVEEARVGLGKAQGDLEALLSTWEEGHRLREGARLVITGRPNAGKSTLLNRLLQRERAIVSPTPGTTRDTIEETFVLNGIPFRLIDTAGIRETDCHVEKAGIARTHQAMAEADLRIHVVDGSQSLSPEDLASLCQSPPERVVVFLNKTDLPPALDPGAFAPYPVCSGSLLTPHSTDSLIQHVSNHFNVRSEWTPHATLSERHRDLLLKASQEIDQAVSLLDSHQPEALVPAAAHLRDAATAIGHITGRSFYPDMLDHIFSRFCIGK